MPQCILVTSFLPQARFCNHGYDRNYTLNTGTFKILRILFSNPLNEYLRRISAVVSTFSTIQF